MSKREIAETKVKTKLLVSVSGGLTSGYMAWWLKEFKSDVYDMTFVFANTGCEHENTLIFINRLDKFLKLNLVWLEAKVNPKNGVATSYTITSFESAMRGGEPYEEVIKKYGIPNIKFKHCNRELKIAPIESFMRDHGITHRAIGIREDEFQRATEYTRKKFPHYNTKQILEHRYNNEGFYYPLILERQTSKDEIKFWWSKMPFSLELKEHQGNCTWCWKKSDRKLWTLALEDPSVFDFPKRMDDKYGDFIPETQKAGRKGKQVFFNKHRSTEDILHEANTKEFDLFVEGVGYQKTLFNCEIDEEFTCNECGTIF